VRNDSLRAGHAENLKLFRQAKKGPPLITAEEDLAAFGFKLSDIVRTPLGITATVIGVK
jgi:hypothetical protein